MRRRLVILALALAAVFGPASASYADDSTCPPDANCAIAINQTSNSSLFEFAFAVKHVLGDVVDQGNGAVAYSSCDSCQTTAIAIEIVLVEGSPSTIAPENVAASVNAGCNLCDTFATAYQFVIMTGGPVEFTKRGLRELRAIRHEIESWGQQHLSNDEIRSRLPDVIARLQHVLDTQLRRVRDEHGNHEGDNSGNNDGQPNAPPASTVTYSTTTTPTTTATDTTATTTTGTTTTATTTTTTTTPAATTTGTTTTTP